MMVVALVVALVLILLPLVLLMTAYRYDITVPIVGLLR